MSTGASVDVGTIEGDESCRHITRIKWDAAINGAMSTLRSAGWSPALKRQLGGTVSSSEMLAQANENFKIRNKCLDRLE